jgi:hypothetical protein
VVLTDLCTFDSVYIEKFVFAVLLVVEKIEGRTLAMEGRSRRPRGWIERVFGWIENILCTVTNQSYPSARMD